MSPPDLEVAGAAGLQDCARACRPVAPIDHDRAAAADKIDRRRHRICVHQSGDLARKHDALDGAHGSAGQGQGGVSHSEGHRTGGAASGRRSEHGDLIHSFIVHIGSGNGGG